MGETSLGGKFIFSRSRYMSKSRSGSEKGDNLLSRVARVTTLTLRS